MTLDAPKQPVPVYQPWFIGYMNLSDLDLTTDFSPFSHEMQLYSCPDHAFSRLEALFDSSCPLTKSSLALPLDLSLMGPILEADNIVVENSFLVSRTGFHNAIQPKVGTNAIYVTFCEGTFPKKKHVQVTAQIRRGDGSFMNCIARGEPGYAEEAYDAILYTKNFNPSWNETFRVDLSPQLMQASHIYFTFKYCTAYDQMDLEAQRTFAFAFLPLAKNQHGMIQDGIHSLTLYKYDDVISKPELYLNFPAGQHIFVPSHLSSSSMEALSAAADAMKKAPVIKEASFMVRTGLFSTLLTQDDSVINLLHWKHAIFQNRGQISQILKDFESVGEMELIKFYPSLLLACFDMLSVASERSNKLKDLVIPMLPTIFETIVFILNIGMDKRFQDQVSVMDNVVDAQLQSTAVAESLSHQLVQLISRVDDPQSAKSLRKIIKVWHILVRFVIRTSTDRNEALANCDAIVDAIGTMMGANSLEHVNLCQVLSLQTLPALIKELSTLYDPKRLLDILQSLLGNHDVLNSKLRLNALKLILMDKVFVDNLPDFQKLIVLSIGSSFGDESHSRFKSVDDSGYSKAFADYTLVGTLVSLLQEMITQFSSRHAMEHPTIWGDLVASLSTLILTNKTYLENDKGIVN